MIFPVKIEVGYDDGKPIYYKEGFCDSSETKPSGTALGDFADGSFIQETNTGDVYQLNKKTGAWVKQFSIKA